MAAIVLQDRPVLDVLRQSLVTLFVTIDPIGLAPLFVVVTAGMGPAERRHAARVACITAAVILIGFALVGEPLIGFLGIGLPSFRIAGGLLLFWIAFEMVFDIRQSRKSASAQLTPGDDHSSVAIFPLAIPLIAGPAAISATILTASRARAFVDVIGLIAVILVLVGACYLVFLQAGRIERALGGTGRIVFTRLFGLLLAALSVQFIVDGIATFIASGKVTV